MRKIFTLSIAALAIIALMSSAIFACGEEDKATKTSASTVNEKADAKFASSKADFCTATAAKACAAKMGMSEEECKALCESGKLTKVNLKVAGMTCTGCEEHVSASLAKVAGVVTVDKVCHESGTASVYFDTRKGQSDALVTAVANSGYKAEIIPAVATTKTVTDAHKTNAGTCSKSCTAGEKAACEAKTDAKKASAKTTDGSH